MNRFEPVGYVEVRQLTPAVDGLSMGEMRYRRNIEPTRLIDGDFHQD